MAYQRAIIQLKPDCHPSDFVIVKLHQSYLRGRIEKRETPATEGSSIEQILYCVREFQETARELNYTEGPELFDNFRRILRSTVKDDWDTVAALSPLPRTPVTFDTALDDWKRMLIMPSARQNMVDYLETLMRPRNMSVENFVTRVKVMVRYVGDIPFPGPNPPTVDDTKLKNIIFRAMPPAWQTNFLRVNHVSTTLIRARELQQIMAQEREFAEPMQNTRGGIPSRRNDDTQRENHSSHSRYAGRAGGRNHYSGNRTKLLTTPVYGTCCTTSRPL
jgi:hypothetical protein